MASAQIKTDGTHELVIEEEAGIIQRNIQQNSPSTNEKRKQYEDNLVESPRKCIHNSDGNRCLIKENKQSSLSVPFWKTLNRQQSSFQFQSNQIGYFSLLNRKDDKECFEDKRYLRVYKYSLQTLNVNFDLKVGESDFNSEGQSKNIDAMLWWTSRHKQDIFRDDKFTFDFLSWRGVLRLIMFSIFEKHSDWLLAVIKFKNAFFLCEYVTDMQVKDEQNMTPEHRSFCYYGHKFEEYVTKKPLDNTSTEPITPSTQFAGVFQGNIGSYRLLYGAEMDCIVEQSLSMTENIELKISAGKSLNDLPFQHNRKFAKWWLQCFLVGIKTMVIGLRDNNGIVNSLEPLSIADIERATHTWNRYSFFNFFLLFAQFLKENVTDEYSMNHKDVVLFRFIPSSQTISMTKSSDSKYHFLPDWFYNQFI
ncbi:unnamed protein product [Rotaria socialis]|uniref:Decapping nuclease n=1 Tax=Rotaria socialis TaxID=392032 RepID=A0A818Y730_9BILA|nr:unnamed protein product [Rotaria socialis]CAF3255578.1 unnamed protein product [Rotaria socialis]CAF3306702.1 unnamed protein product [Rotaria socialis]CAF3749575.1 unnamed protein product [Rotaria socialis]CAF4126390.1 unnamed protein product [Rotaria socialis]